MITDVQDGFEEICDVISTEKCGSLAHSGILNHYKDLRDKFWEVMTAAENDSEKVIITGHSLGKLF
jgi:hypothetical protein